MRLIKLFFSLFFREKQQDIELINKKLTEVVTIPEEKKETKARAKPKPNVKPNKELHKEIDDLEISNSVKVKELLHKLV